MNNLATGEIAVDSESRIILEKNKSSVEHSKKAWSRLDPASKEKLRQTCSDLINGAEQGVRNRTQTREWPTQTADQQFVNNWLGPEGDWRSARRDRTLESMTEVYFCLAKSLEVNILQESQGEMAGKGIAELAMMELAKVYIGQEVLDVSRTMIEQSGIRPSPLGEGERKFTDEELARILETDIATVQMSRKLFHEVSERRISPQSYKGRPDFTEKPDYVLGVHHLIKETIKGLRESGERELLLKYTAPRQPEKRAKPEKGASFLLEEAQEGREIRTVDELRQVLLGLEAEPGVRDPVADRLLQLQWQRNQSKPVTKVTSWVKIGQAGRDILAVWETKKGIRYALGDVRKTETSSKEGEASRLEIETPGGKTVKLTHQEGPGFTTPKGQRVEIFDLPSTRVA